MYLPGIGSVGGLNARNYSGYRYQAEAVVDGTVGSVPDAMTTYGPELMSSPTFADGSRLVDGFDLPNAFSSWYNTPVSSSVAPGHFVFTSPASSGFEFQVPINLVYEVTISVTRIATLTGTPVLRVYSHIDGWVNIVTPDHPDGVPITVKVLLYRGGDSNGFLATFDGTATWDIHSLSVKEISGIPATQATAGNRPALRNTGGKYAWEFDGVNDSLALSSVPLAMSDDFAIITVGQATGAAGWNTLYGQDGATPTCIQVFIDDANGKPGIYYRDDSGTGVNIAGSGDARLAPTVISTANRSNSKVIRVNGVQIGIASITVFGASTFTKAAIGRLGNGTDFHKGPSGPRIIIKGTLTDAEILTLEKWAADITPGGPTI